MAVPQDGRRGSVAALEAVESYSAIPKVAGQ